MSGSIDRFIPAPDVTERHAKKVAAPADFVFAAACAADLRGHPLIRAIFRMRERLLGGRPPALERPKGIVAECLSLGWGKLAERPGRELVMGAVTRPWRPDVTFRAVEPERFAAFAEPDLVKIVWTLEAEPLDATHARLATETRALATDAAAREQFRRYWRLFRPGIVAIRWLLLGSVKRAAERRFRGQDDR